MRRALALLVPALLLAGCANAGERFGLAEGGGDPLAPYFHEYREVVAGSHAKLFDVPVEAGARSVNVTVALDALTNGLPLPNAAPAYLEVRLLDASGATLREATLDLRSPSASLVADEPLPGLYHAEVTGFGASHDLDGNAYGAGYLITIEVLYEE